MATSRADIVTWAGVGTVAVVEATNQAPVPGILRWATAFLTWPLWHYLPLLLLTVVGALMLATRLGQKGARALTSTPAVSLETAIELEFRVGHQDAQVVQMKNIFYWYTFAFNVEARNRKGDLVRTARTWTLFVVFDRQVPTIGLRVDGNITLPAYEIKSFSGRHAIIYFSGDLAGATIKVSANTALNS
jgi:hypothetical protein